MMAENTLSVLAGVVETLEKAGVRTWLFGGWAEDLLGLRPPGPHGDIDLLYPAEDFGLLDEFLRVQAGAEEILAKRFLHKRAFRWQDVRVEVFLVRREAAGLETDFFGLHRLLWPDDTLSQTLRLEGRELAAASPAALRLYRARHGVVEQAYRRYVAQRGAA